MLKSPMYTFYLLTSISGDIDRTLPLYCKVMISTFWYLVNRGGKLADLSC